MADEMKPAAAGTAETKPAETAPVKQEAAPPPESAGLLAQIAALREQLSGEAGKRKAAEAEAAKAAQAAGAAPAALAIAEAAAARIQALETDASFVKTALDARVTGLGERAAAFVATLPQTLTPAQRLSILEANAGLFAAPASAAQALQRQPVPVAGMTATGKLVSEEKIKAARTGGISGIAALLRGGGNG